MSHKLGQVWTQCVRTAFVQVAQSVPDTFTDNIPEDIKLLRCTSDWWATGLCHSI